MKPNLIILTIILIFIIILSSFCSYKYELQEGYVDTSMPNVDMVNLVPVIPESLINNVLSRIKTIISNNEQLLLGNNVTRGYFNLDKDAGLISTSKTFDSCYNEITEIGGEESVVENVAKLYPYIQKQEEIIMIYKNFSSSNHEFMISYNKSKELQEIIDGKHPGINIVKSDLETIHNIEPTRQSTYVECDITKLESDIQKWQTNMGSATNDDQRREIGRTIDKLQMRIWTLRVSPEDIKCNTNKVDEGPIITEIQVDNKVALTTLYYLSKILENMDEPIKKIVDYDNNRGNKLLNFNSALNAANEIFA